MSNKGTPIYHVESDCLNCHTCKYRGEVFNSVHSRCKHPRVKELLGDHDMLLMLMDYTVNKHKIPYIYEELHVIFEPAAIAEGYACWPFNFDPRWLLKCTGHTED